MNVELDFDSDLEGKGAKRIRVSNVVLIYI